MRQPIGEVARLPAQPLALFCTAPEAADASALGDPLLAIEHAVSGERLAAFEVVVKSPGISPNAPDAQAAAARGTRFTLVEEDESVGGSLLRIDPDELEGALVEVVEHAPLA